MFAKEPRLHPSHELLLSLLFVFFLLNLLKLLIVFLSLRYWVPAENENNQDEADDDEVP